MAAKRRVTLKQKEGTHRVFRCRQCLCFVQATYLGDSTPPSAEMIPIHAETFECVVCRHTNSVELPNVPGVTLEANCQNCDSHLMVARSQTGVNCRSLNGQSLPTKLLEMVLAKIPPRPWDQGMHKFVALDLGLSNHTVDRAVGWQQSAL